MPHFLARQMASNSIKNEPLRFIDSAEQDSASLCPGRKDRTKAVW